MVTEYLRLVSPLFGLLANTVIQVGSFRCVSRCGLLTSIVLGCLGGFLCLSVLEVHVYFASADHSLPATLTNVVIYFALCYCYFHFVNLGETARRIRMLRELYDSYEGLTIGEILERYNAKEIVDKRLQRLVSNRQVIYRDGRYTIGNPLMLFIARAIVIVKMALLGRRSEFG